MAGTTSKTVQPDFASMSADELSAFISQANTVRAERELKELNERRAAAMATCVQLITAVPTTEQALKHAAEGEISQVLMCLSQIVTAATEAKRAAGAAGAATGVKVTKGTGTGQRTSRIRDEILAVFGANPGADFSASDLVHELPPAPNGNAVSSGAVLAALQGQDGNSGMIAAGLAVRTQDSPKRFAGVTTEQAPAPDAATE